MSNVSCPIHREINQPIKAYKPMPAINLLEMLHAA